MAIKEAESEEEQDSKKMKYRITEVNDNHEANWGPKSNYRPGGGGIEFMQDYIKTHGSFKN